MQISNSKFLISNSSRGFGLIEIVIVTAIVTTVFFAFLQASTLSIRLLRAEKENIEATLLAQEAMEAVRSIRDESWTEHIAPLATSTTYYPVVQNGTWTLATTSPDLIDGTYTRSVKIDTAYRNTEDDLAPTGTEDSDTRKITTQTSWNGKTVTLVSYLTNFQSFLSMTQEIKTISYEEGVSDTNLARFPSNNAGDGDPAQSFTTAGTINATKIELELRRATSTASDIYVELRSSPTGQTRGTSQIITSSTISTTSYAWVPFRFADPVTLSSATTYYIRLRSMPTSNDAGSGSQGPIHWKYTQTPSSPYGGGAAYRYIGKLSNPEDAGEILNQYDFGFKIYALQ